MFFLISPGLIKCVETIIWVHWVHTRYSRRYTLEVVTFGVNVSGIRERHDMTCSKKYYPANLINMFRTGLNRLEISSNYYRVWQTTGCTDFPIEWSNCFWSEPNERKLELLERIAKRSIDVGLLILPLYTISPPKFQYINILWNPVALPRFLQNL